jgi:hypothetical protein
MTMDTLLRHKLLAYLGGAAITMSSGAVLNRSAELASIPEPIMSDLLMDVHGDGWQPQDLTRLTELLADDPRRQVRRRAAEIFASGRHDF